MPTRILDLSINQKKNIQFNPRGAIMFDKFVSRTTRRLLQWNHLSVGGYERFLSTSVVNPWIANATLDCLEWITLARVCFMHCCNPTVLCEPLRKTPSTRTNEPKRKVRRKERTSKRNCFYRILVFVFIEIKKITAFTIIKETKENAHPKTIKKHRR